MSVFVKDAERPPAGAAALGRLLHQPGRLHGRTVPALLPAIILPAIMLPAVIPAQGAHPGRGALRDARRRPLGAALGATRALLWVVVLDARVDHVTAAAALLGQVAVAAAAAAGATVLVLFARHLVRVVAFFQAQVVVGLFLQQLFVVSFAGDVLARFVVVAFLGEIVVAEALFRHVVVVALARGGLVVVVVALGEVILAKEHLSVNKQ